MIELTKEEKEIIDDSLTMRRNYIETGDVSTSAINIRDMGKHAELHITKLQLLNAKQMKLIIKIEKIRIMLQH